MKSILKLLIAGVVLAMLLLVFAKSCIIYQPELEHCEVVTAEITRITEGSTYDIVFYNDQGDRWYINRGLEQGLILDSLNAEVLNKTVTLHLPKLLLGTSNHIAQLAVEKKVIFTEFKK